MGIRGWSSSLELKYMASAPLDGDVLNLTEKFSPALSRDHSVKTEQAWHKVFYLTSDVPKSEAEQIQGVTE